MNQNDSERIASFFDEKGFEESSEKNAKIIIINSCSIRQSAIDRIEAKIRNIKKPSDKTVILTGCVLDKDKEKLGPFIDYYWPPQDPSSWNLPHFKEKEKREFFEIPPKRDGITAYISITTGCDNFCSYCVVPYVKGKEKSRPSKDIIEEAKNAVKSGYKEIWLLGQNVNSYNGGIKFPALLKEINDIKGNFWIRFTTSHPKDLSSNIISAIKSHKKITKYLHLPIQSGDDKILEKMNRPYTTKEYKEIIDEIRKEMPDISISTDVIVGFPGETEKHFSNTVKLFREIGFDMAYVARYSPRPQTKAHQMEETIEIEEKKRREKIIEEILKESVLQKNKSLVGKTLRVLILRKKKQGLLIGKTEGYKNVLFEGKESLIGNFENIKITHGSSWGLKGKINQK